MRNSRPQNSSTFLIFRKFLFFSKEQTHLDKLRKSLFNEFGVIGSVMNEPVNDELKSGNIGESSPRENGWPKLFFKFVFKFFLVFQI